MRKLLLFTFTMALLSMLSVSAFAQWGKTVTVANDTELIQAMDNATIEVINLEPGYYDYLGQIIQDNSFTKLIKAEGSTRQDCDYFIQVANFCAGDVVTTRVFTEGTSCPADNTGYWSVVSAVPGSTLTFTDGPPFFNPIVPNIPGNQPWEIEFGADLPGEYVLRFDFTDGQFVQGNYYARDIPQFDVSEVLPLCLDWDDECAEFEFVLTVTTDLTLPPQSYALPPFSIEYTVDGGAAVAVEILATDETLPGSGIYEKTLDFCYPECGDYAFVFEFLGSANQDCGAGAIVEREVNIYDAATFDNPDDQEVCGLEANFFLCAYVECEHEDMAGVWTWDGPLGAPDPVFTAPLAPTAIGPCLDEWSVEVFECGLYEFTYTVTNGPCVSSTSFTIDFYDVPVVTIQENDSICGLEYGPLEASYVVECEHTGFSAEWAVYSGPIDVNLELVTIDEFGVVTVPECGAYTFSYTVSNGIEECTVVSMVTINFYDTPEIFMQEDDEICGLVYDLEVSYEVGCAHPDLTAGWLPVAGATFVGNTVTVDACGEYEFTYEVWNGFDECMAVSSVTINFYDIPTIEIEEVADICLDENGEGHASLTATVTYEAGCEHPSSIGYWGVKTGAPGGVVFDPIDNPVTTVTVDACGEYTFVYTVENGPCPPVTAFVIVNFYDAPVLTTLYDEEVCGDFTDVEICLDVECLHPDGLTGGTWVVTEAMAGAIEVNVPGGVTIADITPLECEYGFGITVPDCGVYTFTYSVMNGPCEGSTTFTITFYSEPEPEIFGPEEVNICYEATYTLEENSTCYLVNIDEVTYTWEIIPAWAGSFVGGNVGSSVTINWDFIGPAQIVVVGCIGEIEDCCGSDTLDVNVVAPTLAGQVKYWNQFETYMPTPFPTQDYATYPHDYFYVTLGFGQMIDGEFIVLNDSITTVVVEPRLDEDLNELMSYFEFDLTEYFMEWTQAVDLCEGWFLKIWDGGLIYYELPGGYPINPPQAARHLGNNYTYNNWGGVNATDALAIQIMATQMDINGAPWNFAWVGPNTWMPRYGYYSHSAADVNSSNPYVNAGITALDALTTNYRAVGLLDVFPNSQVGVQYSPNFRVTGRMVPELPYMTWDMPFDYEFSATGDPIAPTADNPDDVPFFHSGMSYLYFTPAWVQKYTSTPISLSDKNYINIYYLASGDLNSSYVPTSAGFKAEPAMALNYDGEQVVNKGEVVTVPIRIDQNAELGAISLDLSYNTSLIEVLGVDYEDDYFMIDAEAGTIRVMWFNLDAPANFAFGDAIANIQVRVIGDISADTRFFELEANTELADRNAQPFKNINLETTALSSVSEGLFMTNYPNPFRSTTMISYSIPEEGNVSLVVYNKLGQVVETLVSTRQDAGTYQVEFGRTDLTPGAYFYRIIVEGEANTYTSTNSMIFMQ